MGTRLTLLPEPNPTVRLEGYHDRLTSQKMSFHKVIRIDRAATTDEISNTGGVVQFWPDARSLRVDAVSHRILRVRACSYFFAVVFSSAVFFVVALPAADLAGADFAGSSALA